MIPGVSFFQEVNYKKLSDATLANQSPDHVGSASNLRWCVCVCVILYLLLVFGQAKHRIVYWVVGAMVSHLGGPYYSGGRPQHTANVLPYTCN
ncbi:hypothetical protein E2C01_024537 [Portunus trituberculatus]|uniref:Uncharacterized protein n=1 Tax=Portunus trituberculatus TaxID=210409 RepID=A0A5B7EE28_PORTR|nr:hypothetical protein [Portunus trituberculatus]